jgi:hypothetical protein
VISKDELRGRVSGLNSVADHVPPHALAEGVLKAVEDLFGDDARPDTHALAWRFAEWRGWAAPEGPAPPREEAAEVEVLDPREEAETSRIEAGERVETPESAKKPCKRCGALKAPEEFGKDVRTADGRAKTCSACLSETRRRARKSGPDTAKADKDPPPLPPTVTVLPAVKPEPLPERETAAGAEGKGAQARLCSNGDECVAYPALGQPAKLSAGNPGDVCFRCEEKAS